MRCPTSCNATARICSGVSPPPSGYESDKTMSPDTIHHLVSRLHSVLPLIPDANFEIKRTCTSALAESLTKVKRIGIPVAVHAANASRTTFGNSAFQAREV